MLNLIQRSRCSVALVSFLLPSAVYAQAAYHRRRQGMPRAPCYRAPLWKPPVPH